MTDAGYTAAQVYVRGTVRRWGMGRTLLVGVIGALVMVAVGVIFAAYAAGQGAAPVEGESFTKPPGTQVVLGDQYSGGKALKITSGQALPTKRVTITETSNVLVRARAGQTGGSPTLTIRVDGTNAGTRRITSKVLSDYLYSGITLQPGTYTIGLKGGNLAQGRNVFVDVLSFPAVTPPSDPPVAVEDSETVGEDSGATTIDVLANDTDADGGTKTIESVTQPANGTVEITNNGNDLSYKPNADYCNDSPGTDPETFTYTISPGGSTATVSVKVTCVDDPPVAVNDSATVEEDAAATNVSVLTNDTDIDGGPKTISSASDPAKGTVVVTGGGSGLTYQPDPNYCNDPPATNLDTFTYTLNGDSQGTVSMTVTCVNDNPVATDESFNGASRAIGNTSLVVNDPTDGAPDPNGPQKTVSGDILSNDTDVDGPGPLAVRANPTFELKNSFLESPGDGDNESAIFFDTLSAANITGRMAVSDTTIQNFEDVGLHVGNNSGTLTIDVTNVTFNNNSDTNGEEGIDVAAEGTANTTLNVGGSTTFTDLEGGAMNVISQQSGDVDMNINGTTTTGTGGPDNFPTPPAMTFSSEGSSSGMTFDITNNDILDSSGDGIFIGHEGVITGRMTGNDVSNIALGDGLRIDTDTAAPNTATILVDGNNFGNVAGNTGIGDDGIQVLHRDGTKTLNLTVTNNQIKNTDSEGIRYFTDDDVSGGGPGNNVRIANNQFGNNGVEDLSDSMVMISQDPGTDLCTHITGNTSVEGITLQQSLSAVLQITQASTAALAAVNGNATVTPSGTITFNGTCTTTPQPTNP